MSYWFCWCVDQSFCKPDTRHTVCLFIVIFELETFVKENKTHKRTNQNSSLFKCKREHGTCNSPTGCLIIIATCSRCLMGREVQLSLFGSFAQSASRANNKSIITVLEGLWGGLATRGLCAPSQTFLISLPSLPSGHHLCISFYKILVRPLVSQASVIKS